MNPIPDYDDDGNQTEASIRTFETADSIRSTRGSILGLYDRTPYGKELWSTSDASFSTANELQDKKIEASELVEAYLSQTTLPSDMKNSMEEDIDDKVTLNGEKGKQTQAILQG